VLKIIQEVKCLNLGWSTTSKYLGNLLLSFVHKDEPFPPIFACIIDEEDIKNQNNVLLDYE